MISCLKQSGQVQSSWLSVGFIRLLLTVGPNAPFTSLKMKKKPKPDRLQVRIEKDIAPRVRSDAELNSRSAQGEVNHVLRGIYRSAITISEDFLAPLAGGKRETYSGSFGKVKIKK